MMRRFHVYFGVLLIILVAGINSCKKNHIEKENPKNSVSQIEQNDKNILNNLEYLAKLKFPNNAQLLGYKYFHERYFLHVAKIQIDRKDLLAFVNTSPFVEYGGKFNESDFINETNYPKELFGPERRPDKAISTKYSELDWWNIAEVKKWRSGRTGIGKNGTTVAILIDLDNLEKTIIYLEILD
jgi:hypothetical protein